MRILEIENFSINGQNRVHNDYLEDNDIDYFQKLLSLYSTYKPYLTLSLYHAFAEISPVPEGKNHIQILYSSPSPTDPNCIGHWVTSYYDKENIYIFDSEKNEELHEDFIKALNILYPYYFCSNKKLLFLMFNNKLHNNLKIVVFLHLHLQFQYYVE